ncbi:MAG: histidine--tRNA ligase [Acidobacteriota bacterium]
MTKHAALPGFRDFYPDEMARRQQIFDAWNDVARRYGFEQYDGPPLESLQLFVEKSGPEIVNQLFNFTDKGGRDVALRPEMTPSLVRMLGARIKGTPRPVRWYSTPQLFRYEKQQRGRLREHFQLNMDIVGEQSVLADADLLAAALDVLRTLGLTGEDVVARYSDRRLLRHALLEIGVSEEALPVAYNVVDKIERDSREVGLKRLQEIGLNDAQAAETLDLTSITHEGLQARFGGNPELNRILEDHSTYVGALSALGFRDYIEFDMKIVRGLAYYTGIVFEIFDRKGQLRAICGGGRYDSLFASLSGIDVPALGFGFGDVVLGELLKDRGLAVAHARSVDAFVMQGESAVAESRLLEVVAAVREGGLSAIYSYKASAGFNLGKALKAADASGARYAVLVDADHGARDETQARKVRVKMLRSGEQTEMSVAEFIAEARSQDER